MLAEIEKMVNYVGIIHKGSIVFQGTFEELQIKQTQNSVVRIETNDNNKATGVISEMGMTFTSKENQDSCGDTGQEKNRRSQQETN